MEIEITFKTYNPVTLYIHYNSAIQGMIYRNLSGKNANFFHDNGYTYKKRFFKMFTFSRLLSRNYHFDSGSKKITFYDNFILRITSPDKNFCNDLATNLLLADEIELFDQLVFIENIIVREPKVEGNSINVKTLSPVVCYSTLLKPDGGKYTCFFQPGEREFERQLDANLKKKYKAFYEKDPPKGYITVRNVKNLKQNIIIYKDFVIKGYSCNFTMSGPQELLQLAIDGGIIGKNSQGFGYITKV